jgi:chromosomal replication initiator protein
MKPYLLRKQINPSIVNAVCNYYCVDEFDIYIPSRKQKWVEIRQVIMYLLRQDGVKIMDIAEFFDMDHSTIIHGIRKIENYIKIYPEYSFIKEICIAG